MLGIGAIAAIASQAFTSWWWPAIDRFGAPRYQFLRDKPLAFLAEAPFPAYASYVYTFPGDRNAVLAQAERELAPQGFKLAEPNVLTQKDASGVLAEIDVAVGRAIGKKMHVDAEDVKLDKSVPWVTVQVYRVRPGAVPCRWWYTQAR